MTFRRVAVLNRGEAAVRFLRTFRAWRRNRDLDIEVVAFATDPDRHAPFVRLADSVCALGPALVTRPDGRVLSAYCDQPAVMAALAAAGCDAVWPGWGFVSEDAAFVEGLEAAGITFIGPRSETLRWLGDKIAARRQAEAAGVPLAPWATLPQDSPVQSWQEAASRVGYPLMVKASAGGGGRGIRRVDVPADLPAALVAVRGEADRSFGGGGILLEACMQGARHVEVQLVGDGRGTAWGLGVRDCSIQRRHQKILEECPSPVLDAERTTLLQRSAADLAGRVNYRGVGTAEFLYVPSTGTIGFLEVNARLQVEHPLTELLFGCDLVEAQLDIAAGFGWTPPTEAPRGHAIEARLNAEDPAQGFVPRPGRLVRFRPPAGPGIRVDTGVEEGQTVAPQFDSMIAKIIAWGATREQAVARLDGALADLDVVVEDGTTNRAFLRSVLAHPAFITGHADTGWLDRGHGELIHRDRADAALIVAALLAFCEAQATDVERFFAEVRGGIPHRLPPPDGRTIGLRLSGRHASAAVYARSIGAYVVVLDGVRHAAEFTVTEPHVARLALDGRVHHVLFAAGSGSTSIEVDGEAHTVERSSGGDVSAPMPAVVVQLAVSPGDRVVEGQVVCVLEAMKMETCLAAPVAGIVRRIAVSVHQQVASGQVLLELDRAGAEASVAGPIAVAPPSGAAWAVAAFQALFTGHDLEPGEATALTAAVEAGLPLPVAELLELFADTEALFDSQLATREGALSTSAEVLFHDWCRQLSLGKAEVDPGFAPVLARVLARIDLPDEGARRLIAWRLAVARAHGRVRPPAVIALLRRLTGSAQGVDRASAALLDRIAALTAARHRRVEDHARLARFLLHEQPWFTRQSALLPTMLEALLDEAASATPRRRRQALDSAVQSPMSLSAIPLHLAARRPDRWVEIAEVMVRRLYVGRSLGAFEQVASEACAAWVRLADDALVARILVVVADDAAVALRAAESALARAAAQVASVRDTPERDEVVEILLAGPIDPKVLDELPGALDACPLLAETYRLTVTAAGAVPPVAGLSAPLPGEGAAALIGRVHRSFGPGLKRLPADIHPEAARRLELDRLAAFDLTRLPAPEPLHAFHLRSREGATDERVFVYADLPSATGWPGGAGWTIERAFREAVGVVQRAQAARPVGRRLYGNRIYLDIQPVCDLDEVAVARIARTLDGATRGLGLEKVVVRARIAGLEGPQPTVFSISRPGRHRLQVRTARPSPLPIEPRTPYRLKVAAARRAGAVYPYEVIRMLCGEGHGEVTPHADMKPGWFVEHDLDAEGTLQPVSRPWGENKAGVVVGLITNPNDRHPLGFTRVFIASDPTHALGALAEPECRRVLGALDLAEQLDLPVEWLPISSGARISMDSGTENLDWTARVLRRLVQFTEAGGEVNIIVHGVNVGAQSYWNAEATMLMHTRGLLIMTADGSMVLTGKKALEYSGGVSAEDERGIGGFERIMGPNGQAQCFARDQGEAWRILFEHYRFTGRAPGERHPRGFQSADPPHRCLLEVPYRPVAGEPFTRLGDIFDATLNGERKKPFDIRQLMSAVVDDDVGTFERWGAWREAATAVVWDASLGGTSVCLVGIESRTLPRRDAPLDGPDAWSGGTLFPESAKKIARALNAASGCRPAVVLANLSGFDGSPESLRRLQLEYGAELGRAVVKFRGPLVFLVVGRYHGGAYVVFSKALNPHLVALAVEGSFASVIGGAPAAAVVLGREVERRVEADPRMKAARGALSTAPNTAGPSGLATDIEALRASLLLEHQGALARAFDAVHSVDRAVQVGSLDAVISASRIRPTLIDAIRGIRPR
jgi:acetyl/propionyl-CoA carboxylase alpha subunit/acetyl-CoA carboxylase carboxyltransferase component